MNNTKNYNRRLFIKTTAIAGAGLSFMPMISSSFPEGFSSSSGKRIGIIGLDTSHSQIFTEKINNGGLEMSGYRVVAAYPHGSKDIPTALEMKPKIIEAVKAEGVEIVSSIEELLTKVDVVLLESIDGRTHYEQALPVLRAGKRMFIDKPIAATLEDVIRLYEAAHKYNTSIFTSSALRFDDNVQKVVQGSIGKIMGADVYTPGEIERGHLDLAWYAIHGVEMLFTVMGKGCASVSRIHEKGTDLVIGVWEDGRIGTVRAIREGAANIAGTAFGEKGIAPLGPFSTYDPLINQIITFFDTGKPPVSEAETIEIFSFMKAADLSKEKDGVAINLNSL